MWPLRASRRAPQSVQLQSLSDRGQAQHLQEPLKHSLQPEEAQLAALLPDHSHITTHTNMEQLHRYYKKGQNALTESSR